MDVIHLVDVEQKLANFQDIYQISLQVGRLSPVELVLTGHVETE